MDKDYTIEVLKDHLEDYLPSTGRSSTKPFRCIAGTHPDNNPSMSYDKFRKKVHCFSCGATFDFFDVIGIDYNLPDFESRYYKGCELYHISSPLPDKLYRPSTPPTSDRLTDPTPEYRKKSPAVQIQPKEEKPADYTAFFLSAHKDIDKTDYHRGLSSEVLERFNVGFTAEWRHPKRYTDPLSPRLIIPTSSSSYIARHASEKDYINYKGDKENKSKVGKVHLFNADAIQTATKPIYIVEGEIDAMSIIDVGGEAVGLGSTSEVNLFIKTLKEAGKPQQPLIIALDNESNHATAKAVEDMKAGLEELGVTYCEYNPYGKSKDANEALNADRERFKEAIAEGESKANEIMNAEKEAYLKTSAQAHIEDFLSDTFKSNPPIPTGFRNLDYKLNGGLYAGLYVLGAISTLGKTSLMLQIADQIAQGEAGDNGNDVLIFSLEMSRNELMSRSISRHTYIEDTDYNTHSNAKSSIELRNKQCWERFTQEEGTVANKAIDAYSKYAKHIYISEGIGSFSVREIEETIKKHILFTGNTPVVFVDYLQILAPLEERVTDKRISIDKTVLELKRLSRDYKTSVFVISSFNRGAYHGPVTVEAFKESGCIEYSADVLMGIQFYGEKTDEDRNNAFQKELRNLEIVILKNRNGIANSKVQIDYLPKFNYLWEVEDA